MAQSTTLRFRNAITGSCQMATKIDILDPDEGIIATLNNITDGQVTEDNEQTVRRTAQFSAVDDTGLWTPESASDILTPFGNMFKAYRGVAYGPNDIEYMLLGTFHITDAEIVDGGEGILVNVTGNDTFQSISEHGFLDAVPIYQNTAIEDAIQTLLQAIGFGGLNTNLQSVDASTSVTATLTYHIGDDPAQALKDLASAAGCDIWFDVNNTLMMAPPPDLPDTADWTVQEGNQTPGLGNLLAMDRRLTRGQDQPNYVIVTQENAGSEGHIHSGVAFDNDPDSPTYIYGKYGIVSKQYSSRIAIYDAQCAAEAQHYLSQHLGRMEQDQLTILANPAMEVGDVVLINRAESKMVNVKIILDQITHPLVPDRSGEALTRRRVMPETSTIFVNQSHPDVGVT